MRVKKLHKIHSGETSIKYTVEKDAVPRCVASSKDDGSRYRIKYPTQRCILWHCKAIVFNSVCIGGKAINKCRLFMSSTKILDTSQCTAEYSVLQCKGSALPDGPEDIPSTAAYLCTVHSAQCTVHCTAQCTVQNAQCKIFHLPLPLHCTAVLYSRVLADIPSTNAQ